MEMDLAPFYGGIFDWISFFFVLAPSLTAAVFIWLNQSPFKKKDLGIEDLLQIWSRVALDSVIVMGICGTMIGIQGMIANNNSSAVSTEQVYTSIRLALLTFAWGGVLAGLAFVIRDQTKKNRDPTKWFWFRRDHSHHVLLCT